MNQNSFFNQKFVILLKFIQPHISSVRMHALILEMERKHLKKAIRNFVRVNESEFIIKTIKRYKFGIFDNFLAS